MSLKLSEPLLTCLALSAALVLSNCSGSDPDSEGTAGASGSAAEAGGAPAIGGTSSTGGVAVNGGAATSGASAGGSASGGSAPVGAGGSPPGNAGAGGRSSAGAAGGPVATGGVSPMGGAAGVAGSTAGSAAGGAAGGMAGAAGAAGSGAGAGGVVQSQEKPRVVVLTDIANEPDDEESLVRFLVNSNEFDVEALIATTSTHLKTGPREDLIRRQVTAYGQVHANLTKHAPGFPTAAHLLSVTKTGQTTFGMAAVGAGKGTAGSNHLISVIDKPDPRPVWVTIWGGANTFA
ncbi:MAG TPA: DUF1593 domain-containing protein, partial [Polyangiaceae bacterium]|nr:DUF1593 domain-containing protein [Polyangiaceae bacterium]